MIHITRGFSRVTCGFKHMSDRVAFWEGRAVPRLALTGLALIWLAGCSADVTRFDASSSPFSNPFSSQTAQSTAPAGAVAAAPLAPATSVASAPLPAAAKPAATASAQPVGGSAAGWSAVGGTPVTVANGETLDTLSRRYGVPSSALLSANGLSSAAEVKGGMRIVVPVYSAGGRAVASAAAGEGKQAADGMAKMKKRAGDVAANDDGKARKAEDKKAEKTRTGKPEEKTADVKSEPKGQPTTVAKAEPAKSDASKTTAARKQGVDDTPTGAVDPKAATAKEPVTSAQADASGSSPEFRWPARGRIIQGFKAGGNDGIDISVPAGTSVRAAESGEVVYAGDGLKGYGNLVLIKHPNGYVTAYANNAELDVKKGEQVKRGQIIAKSGDTGNVNSPQLHFELRKGSTPVDPTSYLAGL
jgi:murein DD-endopeptidase MepM/ murein hydrolase activator NlpD